MKTGSPALTPLVLISALVAALTPATGRSVPPQKPVAARFATVAFSPDGKTLAAANTGGSVQLWDTATGAAKGTLPDPQTVNDLAFSPDGKTLATVTWEAGATLWDVESSSVRLVLRGHTDVIERVAFSADGKRLATASWDGTVRLWDVESGRCERSIRGDGTQRTVAWSADGKALAVGTSNSLRVLELPSGKENISLEDTNDVLSVDFAPDGKSLLMGYSGSKGCTVGVLDLATKREVISVKAHKSRASCVKFSRDGKHFATTGDDPTVQVWEAQSGKPMTTFRGHTRGTFSVAFSPDGARVASSGAEGTARVWDAVTGKELFAFKAQAPANLAPASLKLWKLGVGPDRATILDLGAMAGVAATPDGKTLATGSWEGTVTLWDVEGGKELDKLNAHDEAVWAVAVSSDGKRMATGSWDDTVKVWDLATRRELIYLKLKLGRVYSLAFSPDGRTLATGYRNGVAKLWDVATDKELVSLPHSAHVFGVAFSPDGRTLATAANDRETGKTVRTWDVATGRELMAVTGHGDHSALWVGFSPDGKYLASAGEDGTVKLWDPATGKELASVDTETASILARVGPNASAALPALVSELGHEDLGVRRNRTERFWPNKTDQKVLVSGLTEGVRHDHAVVRAGSARALARLGAPARAAVAPLITATRDKSKFVRDAAADALKVISPESPQR